ncbi:glycoside hydrolase family 7 protein [Apiospora saccharicola]
MHSKIAAIAALVASVRAQSACSLTAETHPSMSWQQCSAGGSCSSKSGSVVIDANWRWTHTTEGYTNCYTGNKWDASLCPDGETCTKNCCVDGADYAGTYGATTSGNALSLQFLKQGSSGTNIGSRFYLMASETKYQMFTLLGNEFTFDVDASKLPCGLNGAVYFVSMDEDGGASTFKSNTAGAKYGTGYCDSQCPKDLKFIDGAANSEGWKPSSNDANSGVGELGSCCAEMDIWEANSISTAYTPHPCQNSAYHSCKGNDCGGTYSDDRYAGDCDPDGCDFNSYRQGNKTFYGPGSGFAIDTTKPVTVVTQFIKGSDGKLSEIKRFYQQGGKTIPNSESTIAGVTGNSITADYCSAQKTAFGDIDVFAQKGGLAQMGDAVSKPMVLVMSVWDDHASNMLWLDSTYPADKAGKLGSERGSCATDSGAPADVEKNHPDAKVTYSNIKFGPIGSTTSGNSGSNPGTPSNPGNPGNPPTSTTTTKAGSPGTTSAPPSGSCAAPYAQCGGNGYSGPTCCTSGTCKKSNDYYSQCLN